MSCHNTILLHFSQLPNQQKEEEFQTAIFSYVSELVLIPTGNLIPTKMSSCSTDGMYYKSQDTIKLGDNWGY